MPNINLTEIEKEFDEKYGRFEICDVISHRDSERIKSFYLSKIKEVIEAMTVKRRETLSDLDYRMADRDTRESDLRDVFYNVCVDEIAVIKSNLLK
jgi:hypothetical protein